MTAVPLLQVRDICKTFGSLKANDAVSLTIEQGEIHALLGENGAGKSTLVKMIFGSLEPDSGDMLLLGQPYRPKAPAEARAGGIGMVFQHFSLFDSLTVAENIALSSPPGEGLEAVSRKARDLSHEYGLPLDPDALVGELSVGERQRIEIIRCLLQNPRLVVLDEPTSVLTPQEANRLFETLFRLRDEGRSVLYISHRLEEVQRLCSTATIMRLGRVVDQCDPRAETAGTLAARMVGGDVAHVVRPPLKGDGHLLLEVDGLNCAPANPFATTLKDVALSVRGGEIVGVAGISGNGQGELFACISGEDLRGTGAVRMDGVDVTALDISRRRTLGAAFVPEERLGHGAVPGMSLTENMLLSRHASDAETFRGPFQTIAFAAVAEATRRVIDRMDVRKSAPNPPAAALSGGNLQKFIVGREMDRAPKLIVVNQPTWGVDAGAAAHIRQSLLDLAGEGAAVLVISQDLDEIFEIASHIAVMADGHMSRIFPVGDITRERVGLLMAGESGKAA